MKNYNTLHDSVMALLSSIASSNHDIDIGYTYTSCAQHLMDTTFSITRNGHEEKICIDFLSFANTNNMVACIKQHNLKFDVSNEPQIQTLARYLVANYTTSSEPLMQ